MKIYTERQQNTKTTYCPTCGNEGHMWMTCPVPAKMMELKKQGKEPDISLYSAWQQTRFSRRNPDGKLDYQDYIFQGMSRANDRQKLRVETRKEKKARRERILGKPAKRRVSCGFCGETGHNRRNCEVMFNFIDDLGRASTNYRKQFYERFVKGLGFAEGALLNLSSDQFRTSNGWQDNWSGLGIVSKINWNSVNMGLTLGSWEYKSVMNIEVVVDGKTITLNNPWYTLVANDIDSKGKRGKIAELFFAGSSWGVRIDSILAPSENIPSEEWFNDEYTECWEWIAKKYSLDEVNGYLAPMIAQWHPSRRGRNAGKLNYRLSQYGYRRKK